MRGVKIFSGSSHPTLTEAICTRLGASPAKAELRKFSNGETSVNIGVSVRNQDVYIVQSGSSKINDSVMELLIMISACKGGSAKSITAVMPYFPYSRQSKKKSHRGAITARMIANLLTVAGIDHVITLDLHASQMQGFFGKPVDNLFAEPLIARWVHMNVPDWKDAVVVSKNAGGTKRVTSLADTLKLNFGIVTTDRRAPKLNGTMADSAIFFDSLEGNHAVDCRKDEQQVTEQAEAAPHDRPRQVTANSVRAGDPSILRRLFQWDDSEYTDERARDVIRGRIVQGHLVDDDHPSPVLSGGDNPSENHESLPDPMTDSIISTSSSVMPRHTLHSSADVAESDDDEAQVLHRGEEEKTITLVGDVRDKVVFMVDDIIDKSGSWIAAAETVVKRGGAKKVYCIATHGLFGDDSLERMEACESINHIVVTNSFPIRPERAKCSKKLVIIDVSTLLAESIRRRHYGESISPLLHLID